MSDLPPDVSDLTTDGAGRGAAAAPHETAGENVSDSPSPRDRRDNVTQAGDVQGRNEKPSTADVTISVLSQLQSKMREVEPQPVAAPALPDFPVEALPVWMRNAVLEVADGMQVPVDMPAMMALGVLSVAAAGRAEVVVRAGWRETLSLYVVVAAESSERKSPVLREMTAPLRLAEEELRSSAEADRASVALQRDVADDAAEQARIKAVKTKGDPKMVAEALDKQQIAKSFEVPPAPRLLAGGDATPEAITQLLVRHGKIAITDTEGGLFDLLAGRHSNGVKNLDGVLQAWSGDTIAVERRGRDAEFVSRPALTLILAIQPLVLARVVRDPEMTGRGLPARFLMSVPAPKVGRRLTGHKVPQISDTVMAEYGKRLKDMALELAGWTDPARLVLQSAALDRLYQFEADVELRLGRRGDLRATGAWGGKYVGQIVRIAGLLHLADSGGIAGPRTLISLEAVTAALRIADYLAAHAVAAITAPTSGGESSAVAELLAKLQQQKFADFTVRELMRKFRSTSLPTADAIRGALEVLEDLGWVAAADQSGRRWIAHPSISEGAQT